jgi:hypothetical protein
MPATLHGWHALTIIFHAWLIGFSRSPPYHMSSFLRDMTPRGPPNNTARRPPNTFQPEYIRNLRPEVMAGSRNSLNLPSRFKATVKNTS